MRRLPRGLPIQWAVPTLAVVAIVGVTVVPDALSAGADTPQLPPLTAVELVTKAASANVTALSGTVQVTAHLGLPDLGSFGGLASSNPLVDFLSGSHSVDVWIGDADHQRVALAAPLAETDWIRDGDDALELGQHDPAGRPHDPRRRDGPIPPARPRAPTAPTSDRTPRRPPPPSTSSTRSTPPPWSRSARPAPSPAGLSTSSW